MARAPGRSGGRVKTRPASPGELTVPVTLGIPKLPPPPADIAALVVEMLQARMAHKLALRGEAEAP
jgi:hypothetical protein